jgi:ferredoxin
MGLFKEVKKPVIKQAVSGGPEASGKRAAYAKKSAPCMTSCPSGTDVRGWLVATAQHDAYSNTPTQAFEAAWHTILEHNPFPAICGRVCQHPCKLNCNRKAKDGSVAINRMEQFIGDFAIEQGLRAQLTEPLKENAPSIAVVGAGPSGLSAAYHLARKGYKVTLIDAEPDAGGMMRYRVPRTIIPAEVLNAEIANILGLGIEFRASCVVGRDITVEQLRREHVAVLFAMGLQKAALIELHDSGDGFAITIGVLPADLPEIPAPAESAEPRVLNTISVAVGQGRNMAEAIAAHLEKRPAPSTERAQAIRAEKIKLNWYAEAKPVTAGATEPITETEVLAEAARCMSCGMCMDCETCWMYCSKNCFVKLPKGEHYKLKAELCNGCGKCAESCPCGYIEMN